MKIVKLKQGGKTTVNVDTQEVHMLATGRQGMLAIQLESATITGSVGVKIHLNPPKTLPVGDWPDAVDPLGNPIIIDLVAGSTPAYVNISDVTQALVVGLDFGALTGDVDVSFSNV
jgi:hypothetical protein